jgi:hypothetical protein
VVTVVEVPSPLARVLAVVDPEDVDQPSPPANLTQHTVADTMPVAEPCERCGCRWIINPDRFVPSDHAECAYCRMWRGSAESRGTSLAEFKDGGGPADPEDSTMEMVMSEGIPVYDPEAIGIDDADGVVDLLERADQE